MAKLISLPGVATLVLVTRLEEIESLIDHPALDRDFVTAGPLANRLLGRLIARQTRNAGEPLDAFRPRHDPVRKERQAALLARLDRFAESGGFPPAPVMEMARYVVEGRERRNARAALAYAVAWPFLGLPADAPHDDAYRPVGRYLWRLHRRTARARSPVRPDGLVLRLIGADRRARAAILARTHGEGYGLHAVEVTLDNAVVVLEAMRAVVAGRPPGRALAPRELAWAAIRTAPALVLRQTGDATTTLPHVRERVPPRTLVLMRMRAGLRPDAASGYEFASRHWSACPARRYVMGLFGAVGDAAVDLARGGLAR